MLTYAFAEEPIEEFTAFQGKRLTKILKKLAAAPNTIRARSYLGSHLVGAY